MKTIKNILSAIIFGAVSAVSFIFTKNFLTKKLSNSKKPVKIAKPASPEKFILDFSDEEGASSQGDMPSVSPEQSNDFEIQEEVLEYKEIETPHQIPNIITPSNQTEFSFCIDYPKCNLPGATSLIYNNMIMVDVESFTLAFHMDYIFNREKGTLTILFNDNSLIFSLYDKSAKFNNELIATDQYAAVYNDLLFIPLPLTAEVFGIKVKQNDRDRILQIFK
jgi:hypothetical protein